MSLATKELSDECGEQRDKGTAGKESYEISHVCKC
jgi:hypothetical protein